MTMPIIKTTLPNHSLLNSSDKKYDYLDSFQGTVVDKENKLTSIDICRAFFSSASKWIDKLFGLRNRVVGLFGLKTSGNITDRQEILDNFKCEKGDQIRLFKVFNRTENEVVIGEDDRHLNFKVSLFLDKPQDDKITKRFII